MSIALLHSRATRGIQAVPVRVEVHLAPGLPGFTIVGLADTAVRESKDRVRSALVNSGFELPQRRITVNLAPADLPKDGGRFDLPIALGILAASGQLGKVRLDGREYIGELALSGGLHPVPAVLPAALAAAEQGHALVVPRENGDEAALAGADTLAVDSLTALCAHLKGHQPLPPHPAPPASHEDADGPCLSEIHGQASAKRLLEICASGMHSLLLSGPPGSGKSMLAARLPGLLPPLGRAQALEVAAIHSLRTPRPTRNFLHRPFRSPHHTASASALVGGGSYPKPGEISLAHHGVLFLDELPEFDRKVLEVLREPLETGQVHIARAAQQVSFPARFQLVAAMNPCPCGYLGDPERSCGFRCEKARRYQSKLSGPLLDRIDLHLEVPAVTPQALLGEPDGETSAAVRERVSAVWRRQWQRQGHLNRDLDSRRLAGDLAPHRAWLAAVMTRLDLSARALHRSLRVARTIADMAGEEHIGRPHLREALSYRQNLQRG
ncbi:YifB family Mg chelatase-like AAA ATPase [Alloalcanivorax mobilis]|uniref:YifB family Mg chelatase-like AAA ATPase n=1 Tax=Alloalcanivorax mobilis TaxID=2019569 RepID=UPI000B5B13A4|nr:YifB family Mg chelatase-like AAA ATPase [Alloalcanivorax mobilis]ASK35602.1 ATP-dependent protease [Alcanivorax sp. N3-2A]|tara:strand:+ start:4875 stop:6362 length:1488 start_codon:yes stop_codon:yes gene_type:complete